MTIAVCPDTRGRDAPLGSFSDRWAELAEREGVAVRVVDAWANDVVDQVRGAAAFLWRYLNPLPERPLGRNVCAAIEAGLGIPVFPNERTGRLFEDKVAQKYALEAAGLPAPQTWVFYDAESARDFLRSAGFPLVFKLSTGIKSKNVALLRAPEDAERWVRLLFGAGVGSLDRPEGGRDELVLRLKEARRQFRGQAVERAITRTGLQQGYFYVQEFLPGNDYDVRVTVVGDRAWAFRRHNRPGDFRASGAGRIDYDQGAIDPAVVRLAFVAAERLGVQVLTIDGLRRGDEWTLGEVSYAYESQAVGDCPGQWVLDGDPESGEMTWSDGPMLSEDAIFYGVLDQLVRGGHHGAAMRPSPAPTVVR